MSDYITILTDGEDRNHLPLAQCRSCPVAHIAALRTTLHQLTCKPDTDPSGDRAGADPRFCLPGVSFALLAQGQSGFLTKLAREWLSLACFRDMDKSSRDTPGNSTPCDQHTWLAHQELLTLPSIFSCPLASYVSWAGLGWAGWVLSASAARVTFALPEAKSIWVSV